MVCFHLVSWCEVNVLRIFSSVNLTLISHNGALGLDRIEFSMTTFNGISKVPTELISQRIKPLLIIHWVAEALVCRQPSAMGTPFCVNFETALAVFITHAGMTEVSLRAAAQTGGLPC